MTPTERDRERAHEIAEGWIEAGSVRDLLIAAIAAALAGVRREAMEECAGACDEAAGDWLQAEESARKAGVHGAVWTYGTKSDAAKKLAAAIRAKIGGE